MQRSLRQRCKSGTTERSDGKGRRNCDRRAALGVSRTAIPRRQTYCRRLGHAERAEGSKQKISCADRYGGASMKVLITGAAGFINGYLISDLLAHGYEVVGIDNFSKYGSPPRSTYGFQKLATEYFAKGAFEQYKLPYTIARPFNCVGIGERRALRDRDILSGNVKLAMSHVVPDLVQKTLKGQDPLHILGSGKQIRHYTYGGDLAKGIVTALEHPAALNEDFNLSTNEATSVLELAEKIWRQIKGPETP